MLATVALTAALISPLCSWDEPGVNKYSGNVAESVQNYLDIPATTRNKLQKRLEKHQYDDIADITRNSIKGKHEYTDLRDMHFGKNQLCRTVTRNKWEETAIQRGLVYCEDGYCVIVPTVCNNVSRITRKSGEAPAAAIAPSESGGGTGGSYAGGSGFKAILPPITVDEPTFESVVNKDILLPSIVTNNEPHWFPVPPPIWNTGGGSCCYIPRPPVVPPPVPEPSTILLMAVGLALLLRLVHSKTRN